MLPDPLPPGPDDLEDQLARRPCPEPGADFRARVLRALADLRDRSTPERKGRRWRIVWQAAAALILALNLAMTVANGIRFQRLSTPAVAEEDPARRRWPRVPDVFEANDGLQRFAASALAGLTPAPDAGVLSRHFFNREEREWAIP
jgi:hypothetical protein